MTLFRLVLPAAVAGVLLLATACGDGPDQPPATRTATTTDAPGGPIVLENPTVTATGLRYVDEVVGTGATPTMADSVTVHYVGRLAGDGTIFDSSVARGQPATFAMQGVVPGFSEAISTMKVGGKRVAYLPTALGYGARGYGPVPPNADIVFEIELLAVN